MSDIDIALAEMVRTIRIRPGMYIGTSSLMRLRLFLIGYTFGHAMLQFGSPRSSNLLDGFQKRIEHIYAVCNTQGWDNILNNVSSDEEEAYDLFCRLWDDYVAEIMVT